MKICDNKSVGILVWNESGKLLLIERKQYNFGFAPPAGHLDGDEPEVAARKELVEEVGLRATNYKLVLEKDLDNPCKRQGGERHYWYVYEAVNWGGEIKLSEDETKSYRWFGPSDMLRLARRLEKFVKERGLELDDLPAVVEATNKYADWKENPGLEPAWYPIFKELGILR